MSSPRVSVVTPFYNTARFLRECIESVLRQDFRDFEYVLVDNCSTDGGGEIAAEYAERDPRIRLLRQPTHLSQVDNYNSALTAISVESTYCKVVQADDWIFPSCLTEMVRLADANPRVGLVSAFGIEGRYIAQAGLEFGTGVYDGREICRMALKQGLTVFGSPTSVLFRADLVRARAPAFYRPTSPFEDVEVCFEILREADFGFVFQVLSFNRREPGSLWERMARFNPLTLMHFLTVHRFGPEYLDEAELARTVGSVSWRYYDLLARAKIEGAPREFWEFHTAALAQQGLEIDRWVLRRHVLRRLLDPVGKAARALPRLTRSPR